MIYDFHLQCVQYTSNTLSGRWFESLLHLAACRSVPEKDPEVQIAPDEPSVHQCVCCKALCAVSRLEKHYRNSSPFTIIQLWIKQSKSAKQAKITKAGIQ